MGMAILIKEKSAISIKSTICDIAQQDANLLLKVKLSVLAAQVVESNLVETVNMSQIFLNCVMMAIILAQTAAQQLVSLNKDLHAQK